MEKYNKESPEKNLKKAIIKNLIKEKKMDAWKLFRMVSGMKKAEEDNTVLGTYNRAMKELEEEGYIIKQGMTIHSTHYAVKNKGYNK